MNILITGTRTGVGNALATHFLQGGHHVVGCSRKPSVIDHPSYRHHEVDLTDSTTIKSMCREIKKETGYLDALVNNAATSSMNHFMMTPEETVRGTFELNFLAVVNCCREAVKLLQKSREPSPAILNVSTVAVPWALEGQLVYSASKSAVDQLTRVMSKELADFNIRVNGIGLPPVDTILTRTVPQEKVDDLIERQTMKRMCTTDDIVGPVEFLVSQQAGFVTGETIFLGGVN
jgi:3-oxoacyl-[acyl-carrier protein] reductase